MTPTDVQEANISSISDDNHLPEWRVRPSEFLETIDLGEGEYIVWNRFFPVPTLLNETALDLLHGSVEGFSEEELEHCRKLFIEKKLAYEGESDPSKDLFLAKVDEFTGELHSRDDSANKFYVSLELSNDPCNVGCTYCMIPVFKKGADDLVPLGRKPPPARSGMKREDKLETLKKVVDQYIQTRLAAGMPKIPIGLSGGEMLAQWSIIKPLIEYVVERYPEAEVTWTMNSSLTILTEEQAEFIGKHKVVIHTSIDGYKENHDKHRVYHNGKGTFDDVLKGVELYNTHNPEHAITGFQGTIAKADEFDADKMFDFVTSSKFDSARLAPNLLGISEEEGEKQADLMMDLQIAGEKLGFQFGDLIFNHLKGHIKAKGQAPFSLYCTAMSNPADRSHVAVNLSTMQASRSCSFVPSANVPLDDKVDIFNPAIWNQNVEFAQERADAVKKHCMGCEIAGICHGACVLSGIDANNQLNPGGCAYLRRLWRRLTAYLLHRGDRIPSQTVHRVDFEKRVASSSESPAPQETAPAGS